METFQPNENDVELCTFENKPQPFSDPSHTPVQDEVVVVIVLADAVEPFVAELAMLAVLE